MTDENGHQGGSSYVLFVWSPSGWTLQQRDGEPPAVGATIENGERSCGSARSARRRCRATAAAARITQLA